VRHVGKLTYFRRNLLKWYGRHGRDFPWRRKSATNYEAIVAEVLLQRTMAEAVRRRFPRFIAEFPSWRRLSLASYHRLSAHLRPLGLWRRRVRSIARLAKLVAERGGRLPKERHEIELLPGVGQYIANAVELFCYGRPMPLLDGNMARVLERVFGPRKLADIRYDPYLQQLARDVVNSRNAKEVNWAILDLAAKVCVLRNPLCQSCPLRAICRNAISVLPVVR
jgi:A/G-specific adenine glycosylase